MNEIRNAYPDEQEKLENDLQTKLELSLKIENLLDQYGYKMVVEMVKGRPLVDFIKE